MFHPLMVGRKEIPAHADDIYDHPLRSPGSLLSRWGQEEYFEREYSDVFVIEQVTAGNLVFIQDGKHYMVSPGEVFILRKRCHHLYKTGPAGFVHKRCLTLDGPLLEPMLYATGLDHCDYVVPLFPSAISRYLRTIFRILRRKEGDYLAEVSQLVYRILIELGKASRPQYPHAIQTAMDFMQRNLSAHLTSEAIARQTGFSPTHFNRLFKKHMQISPIAYFIQKKMTLAQYLLTQTPLSVKEVAAATGYDDPLYYYRPRKNIVNRPVSRGGKGFHFTGDHRETIPGFYNQLIAILPEAERHYHEPAIP
jgi:AraC-like DNA-binding protein